VFLVFLLLIGPPSVCCLPREFLSLFGAKGGHARLHASSFGGFATFSTHLTHHFGNMAKKPKIVWVGSTPIAPITPKERRKLREMMKKRLGMRRKKYPEVRGKVVDYISHAIDDGTLCMNVCFEDKTLFSLRYACNMFVVGADISDWSTGNYEIIREYMKPIPR
jgi:hypothetical protein